MSSFGGNAFGKGIIFFHGDKTGRAFIGKDGKIVTQTEKALLPRKFSVLGKIPFLRGLYLLLETMLRSWRLCLAASAVVLLLTFGLEQANYGDAVEAANRVLENYFIIIVLLLGFVVTRISGKAGYHGAEHKVYNAFIAGDSVTLDNAKKYTRYSKDCGTNLLVFIFTIFLLAQLIEIPFYGSFVLGISIGYELFVLNHSKARTLLKPFYLLGWLVQVYVFTAEPTDKQIEVAIAALQALRD